MITGLIGWWVAGRWIGGLVVDGRLFDILFVLGNENDNIDDDSTVKDIFAVKDTKLYVPVVTLSAKDNQKLLKLLSKGFW